MKKNTDTICMARIISRAVLTAFLALALCAISQPASADSGESDLEALISRLRQTEESLLGQELTHDPLLVQRAEFDGVGGWFSGSKKKKLEEKIASSETQMTNAAREMADLRKRIQGKIFEIAGNYESSGDFRKAISWYLRLERLDDRVRARLASCHKQLGEYGKAIGWLVEMGSSDENNLEISDCYRLWGHDRDEVTYLFKVVSDFRNSAIENKALDRLVEIDYQSLLTDFPDFNLRIYSVFMTKTLMLYSNSPSEGGEAYRSAVKFYALYQNISDESRASKLIVDDYRREYDRACEILETQRQRANEHYLDMLRRAERDYEEARREYDRETDRARREYEHKLRETQQRIREWETKVKDLTAANAAQAEIDSAKNWVRHYRTEFERLNSPHGRDRYIREATDQARRNVEQARDRHEQILRDRERIVEDYIRPYKAEVERTKDLARLVTRIHESVYGF